MHAPLPRAPQREHDVADFQSRCVAKLCRGQFARIRFEHRQIGACVSPGKDRRDIAAVWQSDRDLLIPLQRVLRRDNDIRLPEHAARWPVLPPMHRYHGSASALRRASQIIRQS